MAARAGYIAAHISALCRRTIARASYLTPPTSHTISYNLLRPCFDNKHYIWTQPSINLLFGYSLSRLIRDRFAAVVSTYGTLSLAQSVSNINMRVDLSPRLGGHTVANQPPTTVLLSFAFILPPPSKRCKVSQQVYRVMN